MTTPDALVEGAPSPATAPALDHGAVGNGRLLALISPTSAVEWLCLPRFDSPSIFGRLIDARQGGTFRFLAGDREVRGAMAYVANTNVRQTRFGDGVDEWEVIDFAPRVPDGLSVTAPLELVRMLRPLRGRPRLRVDFDPRPDYGRARVGFVETERGVGALGGPAPLYLTSDVAPRDILERRELVLDGPRFFVLSHGRPSESTAERVSRDYASTVAGWRAWAKGCALPSFAAPEVLRSALCLKLHAHHDSGAIIAAATTSIPEAMGTMRTWDYRYCWLRDSAFVVEALRRLGQLDEGERFIEFLRGVAESGPLQPVYGIGGERDLTESFLPHLAGFGNNGHVRIGNAASEQQQNDLTGELILCLETLLSDPRLVHDQPRSFLPLIERLVEEAIALAPKPDTGIWEFRSMLRPYTFSRAMCWAAIHRGAELARRLERADLARRWEAIAAREREEILARGFNPTAGFFTQSLDGEHPDAANLLLPTIGILDARDARFASTVEQYQLRLVDRGLMLRYRNDDDFGKTTSAFTLCSFWWAEALASTGRLDEAIDLFHRLSAHANAVGLLSEDIDPTTGALLGNFPQAYTHVGLINAAVTIGRLADVRDGKIGAWS